GSMVALGSALGMGGGKALGISRGAIGRAVTGGFPGRNDDGDGGPGGRTLPGSSGLVSAVGAASNAAITPSASSTAPRAVSESVKAAEGSGASPASVVSEASKSGPENAAAVTAEKAGRDVEPVQSPSEIMGGKPVVRIKDRAPDGIVIEEGPGPKGPSFADRLGDALVTGAYAVGSIVGMGAGLDGRSSQLGDLSARAVGKGYSMARRAVTEMDGFIRWKE
ncbi:MAG: hypothetical protein ACPLRM_09065, partial [Anaerolineae bacterium]